MRKDRHLLRQSWKRLRAEIETVRSQKSIDPSDFRPLGINEDWETIESKIHHTFCDLPLPTSKPNWLWTCLLYTSRCV